MMIKKVLIFWYFCQVPNIIVSSLQIQKIEKIHTLDKITLTYLTPFLKYGQGHPPTQTMLNQVDLSPTQQLYIWRQIRNCLVKTQGWNPLRAFSTLQKRATILVQWQTFYYTTYSKVMKQSLFRHFTMYAVIRKLQLHKYIL